MKNFEPTEAHKENSKLARQGLKPAAPKWKAKRWQCRLEQVDGQWLVFINGGKHGLPASDVEVSLWLDLQEAKAKLEKRESRSQIRFIPEVG